jgi:hypothetical protein
MGATTYAVPGLVVAMSWLILGQVPRWLTIGGGALCLVGVAFPVPGRPGRPAQDSAAPDSREPRFLGRHILAGQDGAQLAANSRRIPVEHRFEVTAIGGGVSG